MDCILRIALNSIYVGVDQLGPHITFDTALSSAGVVHAQDVRSKPKPGEELFCPGCDEELIFSPKRSIQPAFTHPIAFDETTDCLEPVAYLLESAKRKSQRIVETAGQPIIVRCESCEKGFAVEVPSKSTADVDASVADVFYDVLISFPDGTPLGALCFTSDIGVSTEHLIHSATHNLPLFVIDNHDAHPSESLVAFTSFNTSCPHCFHVTTPEPAVDFNPHPAQKATLPTILVTPPENCLTCQSPQTVFSVTVDPSGVCCNAGHDNTFFVVSSWEQNPFTGNMFNLIGAHRLADFNSKQSRSTFIEILGRHDAKVSTAILDGTEFLVQDCCDCSKRVPSFSSSTSRTGNEYGLEVTHTFYAACLNCTSYRELEPSTAVTPTRVPSFVPLPESLRKFKPVKNTPEGAQRIS